MAPQIVFLVYLVITSLISDLDKVLYLNSRNQLCLKIIFKRYAKGNERIDLQKQQNIYVHVLILISKYLVLSILFLF